MTELKTLKDFEIERLKYIDHILKEFHKRVDELQKEFDQTRSKTRKEEIINLLYGHELIKERFEQEIKEIYEPFNLTEEELK